jgi:flagellar biosynthesis protein FlhB
VPLQEDAALATALSKLDIGREIPKELYVAVAHVLAFAWSIAGKNGVAPASVRPENQPPTLPLLTHSSQGRY